MHPDMTPETDRPERHDSTLQLLRWFTYDHLPDGALRDTSRRFAGLAMALVHGDPVLDGPELTVALRKLLEAKDAAVRAAITHEENADG